MNKKMSDSFIKLMSPLLPLLHKTHVQDLHLHQSTLTLNISVHYYIFKHFLEH